MKLKKLLLIASLCASVVLHAEITNTIMHENANDGDTDGWYIYDKWPSGAKIENINDPQRGRVIKFTGTKLKNGVNLLGWEIPNNLIQWKMKSDQWGAFYVVIQTNNGFRYLTYTSREPNDPKNGIDPKKKYKIRFGLGHIMQDGNWHTFTRDVQADLKKYEPNNEFIQIDGIKFRGTASFDDIKTMKSTPTNTNLKPIYIIGDSMVHAGTYKSNDGSERRLEGWGEELGTYMRNRKLVKNRALFGSHAKTYFNEPKLENYLPKWRPFYTEGIKNRYWSYTKSLMSQESTKGFLLIEFGTGHKHTTEAEFKNNITRYINEAKNLGFNPVLISELNHRLLTPTRGNTPQWMKEVASSPNINILYLDLNKKSLNIFQRDYVQSDVSKVYDNHGKVKHLRIKKADKLYGYLNYEKGDKRKILKGINNAHMSPKGAKIVAGWVRDLACQSNRADGKELCSQFK